MKSVWERAHLSPHTGRGVVRRRGRHSATHTQHGHISVGTGVAPLRKRLLTPVSSVGWSRFVIFPLLYSRRTRSLSSQSLWNKRIDRKKRPSFLSFRRHPQTDRVFCLSLSCVSVLSQKEIGLFNQTTTHVDLVLIIELIGKDGWTHLGRSCLSPNLWSVDLFACPCFHVSASAPISKRFRLSLFLKTNSIFAFRLITGSV